MAMNIDSSLDEIEKIIPSPKINKNTKDLFSEGEDSKFDLDLKNNNLDSFGDISQINNEEDNSLVINNNKNSKLPSTNENTENSKKVKKNQSTEEIIKNSNELNIFLPNNIPTNRINNRDNNEKKYRILFDKNKKLNINSLREEYKKIKNDDNLRYKPNNYNKKYISIFNDKKQKKNSNLFLNLGNNKRRPNRNIILNTNNDYEDINLKCNFKTNHNSKQKENNDKKRNIKSQIFEEDIFIFDKNNLKNNKNNLFSSVKMTEKTAKEKNNDNFWEKKFKNKSNINKININNINKKNKEKKFYIFEEYKSNLSNNNFKFHTTKSTIIECNKINNKRNEINLFDRYNKLCEDILYTEKNNSKLNSIVSFNKISENNNVEKLDNDFNKMLSMVEKKIRQNKIDIKINEENQRYYLKNKNKINKIIPKLLSISQNENINMSNRLIKYSNRNNMMNNNLNFLFRNDLNLNTQINQDEMKPYKKNIKNRFNNYILSDFSRY